jgi:Asp-tRNA(Asn)/Glu-tRNA(Gln) amidotransferase A subunit family amidase
MMSDEELCYLTVRQAVGLFARKGLSPRELIDAVLRRIAAVNPGINAFGDQFQEQALAAAGAAEARWMKGTARALEGVPLAVKDAQRVQGQRTTFGSPAYRDNIAETSDPMIERLIEAGAIVHARTTVSEFCYSGICRSQLWGTTRNPWNREYNPGGSSGGSAAALAAGMTPIATGTDMGGSIRIPASACGVVGYKPPHGRNPDGWPFNVDRFNHCGALARSVGDLALVQNIISGHHSRDPDSLRERVVAPVHAEPIAGMRIAWSPDLSYHRVDPEVRKNTENTLEIFRSLGCSVDEADLGWTEEIDRIATGWYESSTPGRMIAEAVKSTPSLVSPEIAKLARTFTGKMSLAQVFDLMNAMWRSLSSVFEDHDAFLCPTMTVAAVPAEHSMWAQDFTIDGVVVDPEYGYSMTHQFNVLGSCPAMSVPSGRTSAGVPTGLQIVGRPYDDFSVFRAALAFEEAVGGWYGSPESRPAL